MMPVNELEMLTAIDIHLLENFTKKTHKPGEKEITVKKLNVTK